MAATSGTGFYSDLSLEHCQVPLLLPVCELYAVLVPLLPLQLHVALEDVRAEGLPRQIGVRELGDRLAERLGQSRDSPLVPLLGREMVQVGLHRRRQVVALLDPVQPRVQQGREGEVRVTCRIGTADL